MLERPDFYDNADEETMRQMRAAVEDAEVTLRIYRAVPPEHLEINDGDWVTLSRVYAHDHGYVDDGPAWPVVYADVPGARVWTDGNDPSEYGYDGPALTDLQPFHEGQRMPVHPLDVPAGEPASGVPAPDVAEFRPSPGACTQRRTPAPLSPFPGDRGLGPQR